MPDPPERLKPPPELSYIPRTLAVPGGPVTPWLATLELAYWPVMDTRAPEYLATVVTLVNVKVFGARTDRSRPDNLKIRISAQVGSMDSIAALVGNSYT